MSSLVFDKIVSDSVVFNATEPYEQLGTEDPRVVYRASNGVYYMLYSAVQDVNGTTICRLALATSLNPSSYSNWTRYGPIFPVCTRSRFGVLESWNRSDNHARQRSTINDQR